MAEIFFATNRYVKYETSRNANNFGDRFNAQGPQCFRVGSVAVALKGDPYTPDDDADVWEVGRCELYPEKLDDRRKSGAQLGSAAMFEDLRRKLKDQDRDVIVFIHGFANDFPNTARRAAALERLYGAEGRQALCVMFSWPSDGVVFPSWKYVSDRDDAEASGLAMGRALKRLVEFLEQLRKDDQAKILAARRRGEVPDADALRACRRKLHLVAHSMGNWALRHALQKFVQENAGQVPRVLDHVFLMAADEDADALGDPRKLADLTRLANQVHVYHAKDDVALEVSDKTKGNPDRLGADGPLNLDRLPERVTAVDCSDVSDTILSHGRHQYYRLRREVVEDVVATLKGEPLDDRPGRIALRPGRSWRLRKA
jgi:esterase/lipase superfamily enzyme